MIQLRVVDIEPKRWDVYARTFTMAGADEWWSFMGVVLNEGPRFIVHRAATNEARVGAYVLVRQDEYASLKLAVEAFRGMMTPDGKVNRCLAPG